MNRPCTHLGIASDQAWYPSEGGTAIPRAPKSCGNCNGPMVGRRCYACHPHYAGSVRDTHGRPWRRTRDVILARDNDTCQNCGAPGNHVDHIKPEAAGGMDQHSNLQTLCKSCHDKKTAKDAAALRWGVKES